MLLVIEFTDYLNANVIYNATINIETLELEVTQKQQSVKKRVNNSRRYRYSSSNIMNNHTKLNGGDYDENHFAGCWDNI